MSIMFSPAQRAILLDPSKHEENIWATTALIYGGYLSYRRSFWLVGKEEVRLTKLGRQTREILLASECFGSRPGPQQQAENDCFTCFVSTPCLTTEGNT